MPYRGHIENGAIVLDEPIALPNGTEVTVVAAEPEPGEAGRALLELAGLFSPSDLAEIEEAVSDCRKIDSDGW